MYFFIVALILVVSVPASMQQQQKVEGVVDVDAKIPFCPLERNGNQCRANENQYKCGAFFMSLQGQNETLRWLGALPDMLQKPNVKSSAKLRNALGNVHKKSFNLQPGYCNEIYANTRCYSIMKKFSEIPLDSCAESILNDAAEVTVGELLCQKAMLFAPGQHFQSFVKIGFYHSACGGEWTPTTHKEQPLQLKEELCCRFLEGKGEYFRCDGSDYVKSCHPEEDAAAAAAAGLPAEKAFFHRQ